MLDLVVTNENKTLSVYGPFTGNHLVGRAAAASAMTYVNDAPKRNRNYSRDSRDGRHGDLLRFLSRETALASRLTPMEPSSCADRPQLDDGKQKRNDQKTKQKQKTEKKKKTDRKNKPELRSQCSECGDRF